MCAAKAKCYVNEKQAVAKIENRNKRYPCSLIRTHNTVFEINLF